MSAAPHPSSPRRRVPCSNYTRLIGGEREVRGRSIPSRVRARSTGADVDPGCLRRRRWIDAFRPLGRRRMLCGPIATQARKVLADYRSRWARRRRAPGRWWCGRGRGEGHAHTGLKRRGADADPARRNVRDTQSRSRPADHRLRHRPKPNPTEGGRMRVRSAREQYIRWLEATRDLSPHTIRAYDSDLAASSSGI